MGLNIYLYEACMLILSLYTLPSIYSLYITGATDMLTYRIAIDILHQFFLINVLGRLHEKKSVEITKLDKFTHKVQNLADKKKASQPYNFV